MDFKVPYSYTALYMPVSSTIYRPVLAVHLHLLLTYYYARCNTVHNIVCNLQQITMHMFLYFCNIWNISIKIYWEKKICLEVLSPALGRYHHLVLGLWIGLNRNLETNLLKELIEPLQVPEVGAKQLLNLPSFGGKLVKWNGTIFARLDPEVQDILDPDYWKYQQMSLHSEEWGRPFTLRRASG